MSRKMKVSGIEWVGQIPEEWTEKKVRLGFSEVNNKNKDGLVKNALKFKYGTIIPKDNFDADEEEYVADTVLNYNIVSQGDIMINGLNLNFDFVSIRSAMVEEPGIITSAYLAIRPDNRRILPKYANYLFRGYDVCKAFHNMGVGMRKTLSFKEFKHQPCLYPSLDEQHQIVSFLDRKCFAIDTAIEKTKKSIEILEEYKKAVITKVVTKGLDPDAKMKDSGVEWIGEVPENWGVKQLRAFYSRRQNKNTGLKEKNLLSLSYGNIIRKSIDTKEGLLPESFDGYNIVEADDIVIRGTDLQNDHRSLRTGLVTERGIITSAYITLKPKADVNSEYYHYLLHCYDIEKVFYSMGGGLRQSLDYWDFIRTYVIAPSRQEQAEIVSYINGKCSAIDALIAKKQKVIKKWEEYKKSLIYYAVTGKIDCRNEAV